MRSVALIIILASLVAGCAFGRKQAFDSARIDVNASSKAINVAVLDHRPYVVSGEKPETFTGLSRGGFGNPFNVNTKSGQPLATDMANALATSLRGKGATVTVMTLPPSTSQAAAMARLATPSGKGLLVELTEWKSDKYMRTNLEYDVKTFVIDPSGRAVGETRLDGIDNLGAGISTMDTAPVASFGQKMQQMLSTPAIANQL